MIYLSQTASFLFFTLVSLKTGISRGCDPPEAFILHREIVLTMKASITLRAYLTTEVASIAR